MAEKLSPEQVNTELEKLNSDAGQPWEVAGDVLTKNFQFENFTSAFAFVTKVAEAAEEQNHHPKIIHDYNKVTLELTTHDVGGISPHDFTLAQEIETI